MLIQKTVAIDVQDRRKDGGRIIISTGSVDRDRDRVFPQGAKTANYMQNPVVQWGHNYMDPWATIGRTRTLEMTEVGITADFELRPAANQADPQNIVLLLWEQEFVRTASIGFKPETAVQNDLGGMDFPIWELLEWSLVPIPANQDALRLAAKSYPEALEVYKRGRVLSAKNESRIRAAYDELSGVLAELGGEDDDGKATTTDQLKAMADVVLSLSDEFIKLNQLVQTQHADLATLVRSVVEKPTPLPIEETLSALRTFRAAARTPRS